MRIRKSKLLVTLFRITVLVVTVLLIMILFIEEGGAEFESKRRYLRDIHHVQDTLYVTECGSCHLAYPAGLLPERSWLQMIKGLSDHFGENAEVDEKTESQITAYLTANAAERGSRRSLKINESIPSQDIPLRFSETRFYQAKHKNLSDEIFTRKSVGSKARCQACHPQAETARFSASEVKIPD